jgi:hypothetical protein
MDNIHISYYIKDYVETIKTQFELYIQETPIDFLPASSVERMKTVFYNTLKIDNITSKKYTKIITMNKTFRQPIVHSFILNRDDNTFGQNFVKGDILLPDYYFQPYRDRTYGNVFDKSSYRVNWHRPLCIETE